MHLLAAPPSVLGLLRLRPEQNRDSAPTQTAPLRSPQWRATQTVSFPSYWPGISSTVSSFPLVVPPPVRSNLSEEESTCAESRAKEIFCQTGANGIQRETTKRQKGARKGGGNGVLKLNAQEETHAIAYQR